MDPLLTGATSGEESHLAEEGEEVDPRIQGELEKLNQSTDDINRLETELEEFRQRFRAVLVEATLKLDEQVKKIGRAVDDSKPYWEARKVARQVVEAEQSRVRSEAEHKKTAARHHLCVGHMKQVEKKLRRSVSKSKPYFELKAKYYLQLEQLKRHVDQGQAELGAAKAEYRAALRNLEGISEEIHARRRSVAMGSRERGAGSEGHGEDVDSFKMDPDGLSMVSLSMDDTHSSSSEDDTPPSPSPSSSSSCAGAPEEFPSPAQTQGVLVGTARHSWTLGANAAGRPLQTATRTEVTEQR
ncbi:SH3 domain-binding protein 5-like isoform X4 [Nerophis ophidion]|uniref:SH3 domain-binding protein 5-like isoform X4 n=1 Tax=Nerophis ophidion TaxID=159077 RepID=UPI002ADF31BA|nr:SH3 domain-binding protein 5-like isoform X4 [Nerophis ophidion]